MTDEKEESLDEEVEDGEEHGCEEHGCEEVKILRRLADAVRNTLEAEGETEFDNAMNLMYDTLDEYDFGEDGASGTVN